MYARPCLSPVRSSPGCAGTSRIGPSSAGRFRCLSSSAVGEWWCPSRRSLRSLASSQRQTRLVPLRLGQPRTPTLPDHPPAPPREPAVNPKVHRNALAQRNQERPPVVRTSPVTRGRAAGHQPANRPLPEVDSPPATTDAAPLQGATPEAIVRRGTGKRRKARRLRVPVVYASAYAPCEGRHLRAFAYICPWCGLGHLGRARTEAEIAGPRRAGCGRLVLIRVARVCRGRMEAAA